MACVRLVAGIALLIACAPSRSSVRPTLLVPPPYPSMLQSQEVEGFAAYTVRVRPDGRADLPTFRVDTASHPHFARAVQNAVPRLRWEPTARDEPRWFTHAVRWVMLPADSVDGSVCPRAGADTTVVCGRRIRWRQVVHE